MVSGSPAAAALSVAPVAWLVTVARSSTRLTRASANTQQLLRPPAQADTRHADDGLQCKTTAARPLNLACAHSQHLSYRAGTRLCGIITTHLPLPRLDARRILARGGIRSQDNGVTGSHLSQPCKCKAVCIYKAVWVL